MRLLNRLLDDARAGRSGVLAIRGEVGVGKSALLDFADGAATGMNVLRARGVQTEARIPFSGLSELLRPALRYLDHLAPAPREALEGALALRPALARDRFAVSAATLALLSAYSDETPLLVLIDDAHWLDGSSTATLLFAFNRLVADPIAVLMTIREGEASLIDGTDLPVHQLEGLDRDATAELVTSNAGSGRRLGNDLIDRIHQGTGGNPLALIELTDDVATLDSGAVLDPPLPVASRIARVYLDRCASLSDSAGEMLLLAATSDTGELSVLTGAASLVGLRAEELRASEAIGLVRLVDQRVEFRHPLIRSAVYTGAPPDRRRAMHRALARALPDAELDRRAWHLALSATGPDDTASSSLEQAAIRARTRSAYDVASQAFQRAGSLASDDGRRCALLLAAAESAWLGGLAARSVTLLDETRRRTPPISIRVPLEHVRGHIATRLGPVGKGQRILLDGAELASPDDPDRAVVMLAEAVNAAFYAGDARAMHVAAARIPSLIGPGTGPRTRFFAAMAQGMALIFRGEGDAGGAALVRDAMALAQESDELSDDPRLLAWAAMGPLWLRESEAGQTLVDRALDLARVRSAVGVLPFLLSHLAVDAMAGDRWVEAEARFHEAIGLARETNQRTDLAFALARFAWLEARQGDEQSCRSHAAEARTLAGELDLGLIEIWSLAALGDLELGLGNFKAALSRYEEEWAALVTLGIGDADLSPEPELVELHLRLGQPDRAAHHLSSFERAAPVKGQPWALARAARCRGLLGPDDDLDRRFGEALALHDKTPDVFERARTLLAYGGRLRRARQRVKAREPLREALSIFHRLGATPWSAMAGAELDATGETARRRDPSTHSQLTPQELQVALLLSAGRTTREAAATLFLSPKTIEYHLRSAYRKLGINSHDELARRI